MFLAARAIESMEQDWSKLVKLLSFMHGTIDDVLTLGVDIMCNLHWETNIDFAARNDMDSHAGMILSLRYVKVSCSTIKKINY